ncbi:hypothetical protein [Streptomyces carpaticus]|uniref:Uncharacterized protein n=1 Tax=Streptomyces carpaticus TaxID=285558 RepID=A0ABV4ZHU2_9ACTN
MIAAADKPYELLTDTAGDIATIPASGATALYGAVVVLRKLTHQLEGLSSLPFPNTGIGLFTMASFAAAIGELAEAVNELMAQPPEDEHGDLVQRAGQQVALAHLHRRCEEIQERLLTDAERVRAQPDTLSLDENLEDLAALIENLQQTSTNNGRP